MNTTTSSEGTKRAAAPPPARTSLYVQRDQGEQRESPQAGLALQRPAPLLVPAVGLMVGILTAIDRPPETWGYSPAALGGAFALAAAAWLVANARWRRGLALGALFVAGWSVGYLRQQLSQAPRPGDLTPLLTEEPVLTRVRGVALTAPMPQVAQRHNPYLAQAPALRSSFLFSVEEVSGGQRLTPAGGRLRVSVPGAQLDVHAGDRLSLIGWLSRPRGPRNPGERDLAAWYARERIAGQLRVENRGGLERLAAAPPGHRTATGWWRQFARTRLLETVELVDGDRSSQLLDAMVLGQRSGVSPALHDAFMRTASIHILSVSGFHVALLSGAAWWWLRRWLGLPARPAAAATAAVLMAYAVLAEANAPILRATIMGLLGLAAVAVGRPFSLLNWLALAALVILLIDPTDLRRAGFQLSFVQVLTIVLFARWLQGRFLRGRTDDPEGPLPDAHTVATWLWRCFQRGLAAALAVSTVSWLVSLPLAMLHFGVFAPYGILQTCLLTPLFSLAILAGFATLAVAAVLPALSAALVGAVHVMMDRLIELVSAVGALPGSLWQVPSPPAWLVALTYGLAVLIWLGPRLAGLSGPQALRGRLALAAGTAVLLLPSWLLAFDAPARLVRPSSPAGDGRFVVLSVGNGLAALAISGEGAALAVDVGTAANLDAGRRLVDAWRAAGRPRLEGVLLTENDYRAYSGLVTFLTETHAPCLWAAPPLAGILATEPAWQRRLARWQRRGGRIVPIGVGQQSLGGFEVDFGLATAAALDETRARCGPLRLRLGESSIYVASGAPGFALLDWLRTTPSAGEPPGSSAVVLARPGRVGDEVWRELVERTRPGVVVISCDIPRGGRGYYPDDLPAWGLRETTDAAAQAGVPLLETWETGAVIVHCRRGGWIEFDTPFQTDILTPFHSDIRPSEGD